MQFTSFMGAFFLGMTGFGAQAGAVAPDPYFDVRCNFASSAQASSTCQAKFRLCTQSSGSPCEDRGTVTCAVPNESFEFDGTFQRSTKGNEIFLLGNAIAEELSPLVVMGPAKTPPKPGLPVVADSRLEFSPLQLEGECAVRLVR